MIKVISSKALVFAILSAAVCLASALILFPKIPSTSFHSDESGWISSAYYYTELLSVGDFDRAKWEGSELSTFGSLNMHLGEWLIGMALEAGTETRRHAYAGSYYTHKLSFYTNLREGRVPPWEILSRARRASAWFGVTCCFLMFAIGYAAFDVWIGLVAAALLLWSEAFRTLATQAMTDVFYLFFLLCGCLAIVVFSKTKNEKRALFIAAGCGLLAGLACSVKITGLVIVGATFLLALMQRYGFRVWRQWKETLAMAGIFSCCALLTVYALNPYFWPSWKDIHVRSVPHEMRMMLEGSIAAKSIHVKGRYPDLRELARPLEFPRMFRRWKELMRGQQSISEWKHNRLLDIHARLASYRLNPPGEFIFVGIGVVALLWKRCSRYLPARDQSQAIPLFYFFVNYFFILLFIQLNWIRYYLSTMVAAHLIAAVGIYAVIAYAQHALAGFVKLGTMAPDNGQSEARAAE